MTNVTANYFTDNFRMRFRFEGEGGNNFYLDDINIYSGGPSNDLVLAGLEQNNLSELVLYPNPTDADLHLTFSSLYAGAAKLKVTDLTGKVVQAYPLYLQEGKNMIITQTNQLAAGSYLLQLEFNGAVTTLPFVVE
jgi:hypothetical protein